MKTRVMMLAALAVSLCAWGQTAAKPGILTAPELKTLVPQNYFFGGRLAPVEGRNSAGLRLANGKLLVAAPLVTSGYATAMVEKLQGLLISESAVMIESMELKPGAYGFGFKAGKFVVMDVGANDVLSVTAHRDDKMHAAVPLKIVEQEGNYRLYAGRDFVTLKQK